MKAFLKNLDLKETKNYFSPLDADYRIASKSNIEDQLYVFLEENVIVFPRKSSRGYKITNNVDLMKPFSQLQKE